MTVSEQTIFTASTANGVTTVFPYSFKITDEEDLAVTVDGVLQTSGYTVSGVGDDAGGNVTFTTAPANLAKVVRYLAPKLKREEDYQQFGDWLAEVVNRDFDRLWLALQAKNQDTSRSIKLPVDTADDQTIEEDAAARAGKFISFDSYGNVTLSVLADLTTLSAVSAFMETLLDDATAAAACSTLGARQESDDVRLAAGKVIIAEGTTDDAFETTLSFGDPTADRALALPDKSGTIAVTGDIINLPAPNAGAEHKGKVAIISDDAGTSAWGAPGVILATQPAAGQLYHDFSGIPTWATTVEVLFVESSLSGTSNFLVQVGDSGGPETSGYVGSGGVASSVATSAISSTAGVVVHVGSTAGNSVSGRLVLSRTGPGNTWVAAGAFGYNQAYLGSSGGSKTLSGGLDRIRVTSINGTDTIDGGSITVRYS